MNQHDSIDREQRLQEALVACVEAAETGYGVDQRKLLERYPEFAAELHEFFSGQAGIEHLAERLRELEAPRPRSSSAGAPTLAPGEAPAASLPPGTRVGYFGDYELLEEIGRGGMGVVYKARQVSLNRTVALKMILAGQLANEDEVRRFHAEAEAAAKLDHPGIVAVYEVSQHENQHYFSMAFIEGESLARKLAQGLPPARHAAELVRKVAEAIAYAHVEGVIHRDLKPANILMDKQGQPRLTDFGLAKRIQADPKTAAKDLTATGQILGTPSYMPPEQASGQRGAVGPLADVYSLGAILYCLLTGRPPFQADNPLDTLLQVLQRDPVAPRQVNPAVPRDLETICLKCLEKEPRKRYSSARELVADLDRFLDGKPILARPAGTLERVVKWARRRPAAAALALVSSLALTVVTVAWIVFTFTLDQERRRAEKGESDAISQQNLTEDALRGKAHALKRAEKGEADAVAQQKLTASALKRAEGLRLTAQSEVSRRDNPRLALLLALEAAGRLPGLLANNAMQAAMDECRERKVLVGHKGPVFAASFSADGKKVVTCSEDGTARMWDAFTGKPLHVLPETYLVQAHISPDGRRIVTLSGPSAFRKTIFGGLGSVSRDFWATHGPAVRLWDAMSGRPIIRWQPPPSSENYVFAAGAAFSPNSRLVVTFFGFHPEGHPMVHDATTGKQVAVLKGHCPVFAVAFSPDNRTIATAGSDDNSCLWHAESGKRLHALKGHKCDVGTVIFNNDGKLLLSLGTGNKHRAHGSGSQGYTALADDAAGRVWDTEKGQLHCALKWPDGDRNPYRTGMMAHGAAFLASNHGEPHLWKLATGESVPPFRAGLAEADIPRYGPLTSVTMSTQGRLVTFAGQDRAAHVIALGSAVIALRGHDGIVHTAACSPDESQIVTAAADGTARLWAAPVPGVPDQSGPDCWGASSSVLSPDGRRLFLNAFTSAHGALIDPASSREISRTRLMLPQAHFSPDGKKALILGIDKGDFKDAFTPLVADLIDAGTGQALASMTTLPGRFLALSSDSRRVLVAVRDRKLSNHEDGSAAIWELLTGKKQADLKGHTSAITDASFSPDGRRILTLSSGNAGRLWDAATGKEIGQFGENLREPTSAAFLGDGKQVVAVLVSPPAIAHVVSADTGKLLMTLTAANVRKGSVAYNVPKYLNVHPDGRRVLIDPYSNLPCIYDATRGGEPIALLQGHTGEVISSRFTADGRRVLTASQDRTARLWDADTGKELQVFKGHDEAVKMAALDPSGDRLVTASSDQTVRLWDTRTGEELARLRWPHELEELAFTVDGRRVIVRGQHAVRLWPIDILATAQARRPRELTQVERLRFELPNTGSEP